MSNEEKNFNATLELFRSVASETGSVKSIILDSFNRTMNNCRFYEQEGNELSLLNEIGVLRGLAYALDAFSSKDCYHSDDFIHFINRQQELLGK